MCLLAQPATILLHASSKMGLCPWHDTNDVQQRIPQLDLAYLHDPRTTPVT